MSAAGLQEQAEALLKTLAIESHEKELQHLAHRGVASFDRSGMNEQHRRSYGRSRNLPPTLGDIKSAPQKATDLDVRRVTAVGMSKRKAPPAKALRRKVLSEHIKSTLSLAVPKGYHGCATAPPLDKSLVGRLVAFRWNMGWEVGTVNTIHDLSRSRHASETKLNWHIPT
jgi:hypothetical protein